MYHKILWELDRDVMIASSHEDIEVAVEKARLARNTFLMSRAKVLGQLSGALNFKEEGGSESYDMSLVKPGVGQLLWAFAHSINELFKSPVYRTYTYMSYEFDNVLATAQISDLALRQGEIMGSLKGGILSLTDAWHFTCMNYGALLAHYKKL